MSKIYKISLILIALLSVVEFLSAHGLGMHLYLGSQTPEVWRDFDPDFYHALTSEDSVGVMTRKFYYIGLMLPDLIDTNTQKAIRSLLITLHDTLPTDTNISLSITISRKVLGLWIRVPVRITADIRLNSYSPLRIYDETYNQVQQLMYFNGEFPNTNLTELHEMVEYARIQRWSTVDKAMIYGAYMHVIHDLYAHMVLQPALFGYPYAIEADSAFGRGLLYFPELYYELFTETYIPDWSFMEDLYKGYVTYLNCGDQRNHFSGITPYSFFTNEIGTTAVGCRGFKRVGYQDWQTLNFSPVQKFVEAAQAIGYAGPGLTQERLESYLHGAAILLYMHYGYNDSDQTYGGMFSHTNWNIEDIIRFVASPFLNQYSIQNIHVEGNAGHVGDILLEAFVDFILWSGVINLIIDPTNYARNLILRNPMLFAQKIVHLANGSSSWHREWTYFLEGTQGMDEAIDSWENDSIVTLDLKILRREIGWWDLYCQQPAPSKREFYEGEVQRALNFVDLYKLSVEHGQSYLDYESWSLARKAGVLGGMWEIDLRQSYYHQPGVLSLSFSKNNTMVYTSQDIPIEGPPAHIDLSYDLVTFGRTKVGVYGDENENEPLISDQLDGTSRHRGNLTFNAQDAVNSGVDTVHFVVKTARKDDPNQFATMFSSDYRDVYNTHSEIYTNPYYQHYFSNGNPVRSADQSPAEHPDLYWPYILPLNRVLTVLNEPANVAATVSNDYHRITLTWTDRSNYEDEYIIQKRTPDSDWQTVATLAANSNSFTDNSVDPFYDYEYRIWASGNGVTSDTVYIQVSTDRVVHENVTPNDSRLPSQLVYSDDVLHMVYSASNGDIYYKYSNDNGMTWSSGTYIGHGNRPTIAASDGYVVVVWDSSGYILYRYKNGSGFSTTYRFKPQGTRIEAYSPAVEVESDTARIAFGGNNDHAHFVFYREFPVTAPPSGISQFDTVWAYNHHIDTLRVTGIVSYSIGQSKYIAISFWSYGYIRDDVWGSEVHMYERLPGSSVWQNGLTGGAVSYEYAEYISNPVIDESAGMLFIGFSVGDVIDIWGKNIATGQDTIVTWSGAPTCGHGPLYLANGKDVLLMTYNDENSDNMELLVLKKQGGGIDHIPMSFSSHRAAGLCVRRVRTPIKDNYYALLPIDREKDGVSTRYFKNRLAYTYIVEQSPLEGEDEEVIPRSIQVDIVKNILREGEGINVKLSLPARHSVKLRIYDVTGRVVNAYKNTYDRGVRIIKLDPELPAGVYFLKAEIGGKVFTRKITIIG